MRKLAWDRITTIIAFSVAMGYLEAVVVVYIRKIMGIVPTPEHLGPTMLAQVPKWIANVEQTREAATIIMLVCLALLSGRNRRERLGVFMLAFGVWDVFYYVGLKALIGWPASLLTLDCLFLIPKPWYAPVWMPMAASCVLIAAGIGLLWLAGEPRGGLKKFTKK